MIFFETAQAGRWPAEACTLHPAGWYRGLGTALTYIQTCLIRIHNDRIKLEMALITRNEFDRNTGETLLKIQKELHDLRDSLYRQVSMAHHCPDFPGDWYSLQPPARLSICTKNKRPETLSRIVTR